MFSQFSGRRVQLGTSFQQCQRVLQGSTWLFEKFFIPGDPPPDTCEVQILPLHQRQTILTAI